MVPVLKSELLSTVPGVRHAFFTRNGGVSKGIYRSLNLGVGSKDNADAVADNRALAATVFEVDLGKLLTTFQVHSSIAVTVTAPWAERPEADAIVTATPGLVCGALSADCAPVLIVDPEARIVASAHAGWKGALGGVVASAVEAMTRLGAKPERCLAAVGPCIGPQSYEVSADFVARFEGEAPGSERFFRPAEAADKQMFDLPGFVLDRIEQAGIGKAEWIGGDTCAEEDRFYSNRRATLRGEPDYGRLMSAVMLVR